MENKTNVSSSWSKLSYWHEPSQHVLHLPPYSQTKKCTLGESGSPGSSTYLIYVPEAALDQERSRMILPDSMTESERAFFRAVIRLNRTRSAGTHQQKPQPSQYDEKKNVSSLLCTVLTEKLPFLVAGDVWIKRLFPPAPPTSVLVKNLSSNPYLNSAAVRCLSWHPKHKTLALVDACDMVFVLSCDALHFPLSDAGLYSASLKHESQTDVTALCWDPLSEHKLAVCCVGNVLVWNVNPEGGASAYLVFKIPSEAAVMSSVFICKFSLMLLLAVPSQRTIVCDLITGDMENVSTYQNIHLLKSSPDSVFVAYASTNGHLGILYEDGLESLWRVKVGAVVVGACWLPNSSGFLFAKRGHLGIFLCRVRVRSDQKNGVQHISSVTKLVSESDGGENPEGRAWEIVSMVLDATGSRLAILLTTDTGSRCFLCKTELLNGDTGLISCSALGWIVMSSQGIPVAMDFLSIPHGCGHGILTIASQKGHVMHYLLHDLNKVPPSSVADQAPFLIKPPLPWLLHLFLYGLFLPLCQWLSWLFGGSVDNIVHLPKVIKKPPPAFPSTTQFASFVESNPLTAMVEERKDKDILGRSIVGMDTMIESEHRERSQHHMSVDRSPEPSSMSRSRSPSASLFGSTADASMSGGDAKLNVFRRKAHIQQQPESDPALSAMLPSRLSFAED